MSKFQGLMEAARGTEPVRAKAKSGKNIPATVQPKRRGRPPGRRSDPDYEQITAYIRRDTHQAVKVALLQDGKGQAFSELVEQLLAKWLKARG